MLTPDLRDSVTVRAMAHADGPLVARFADTIPDGERRFLKENLQQGAPAEDAGERRLVALDEDDAIIGVAGAFPGEGWSSHVAELRVLVSATHRRQGIGRALAEAALLAALDLQCSPVYVEVVAEQEALVAMFQDLGFEPAALLPDFVRDSLGEYHDLMLLTCSVDDRQALRSLLALDEVGP